MPSLTKPTAAAIEAFLAAQARREPSYPEVGSSWDRPPAGYALDHNRIQLGEGREAFERARAERGEERFSVEWREDDMVWYDLLAFSRPRLWLARLAHPLTRRVQRRFARESKAAMQAACGSTLPS